MSQIIAIFIMSSPRRAQPLTQGRRNFRQQPPANRPLKTSPPTLLEPLNQRHNQPMNLREPSLRQVICRFFHSAGKTLEYVIELVGIEDR